MSTLDLTLSELPPLPIITVSGKEHITSEHFPPTSTLCMLVKTTIVALCSEVAKVVRKVLVLELCPILEAMLDVHVILFLGPLVWACISGLTSQLCIRTTLKQPLPSEVLVE